TTPGLRSSFPGRRRVRHPRRRAEATLGRLPTAPPTLQTRRVRLDPTPSSGQNAASFRPAKGRERSSRLPGPAAVSGRRGGPPTDDVASERNTTVEKELYRWFFRLVASWRLG